MYPVPQYQRVVIERNGMATASMVLGIIGLVFSFVPIIGLIAWILNPLALVFGLISGGKPVGQGARLAGIITSSIGLLICFLWVAVIMYGGMQIEA